MVKITLELNENELEMFTHCIELAIDTKYLKSEKDKKSAGLILKKLHKYLLNPKV